MKKLIFPPKFEVACAGFNQHKQGRINKKNFNLFIGLNSDGFPDHLGGFVGVENGDESERHSNDKG